MPDMSLEAGICQSLAIYQLLLAESNLAVNLIMQQLL